jgi:hypothetical protein
MFGIGYFLHQLTVKNNKPLLLTCVALVLGGAASRNASTPSTTPLTISGDIDIACRANLSNWRNSNQSLVSKLNFGTSGYELQLTSVGYLNFAARVGSTNLNVTSTNPNLQDGQTYWVRATRIASTGVVSFYTAPDSSTYPTTWTQVGTSTTSTTGNIATTSPLVLRIGQRSTGGQNVTGKIYAARISDSIGGTPVFDANFSIQTALATSFTAATGQTVTINSNGSTPSLTALPRVKDFWQNLTYGAGTFTIDPITKLKIRAIAAARGIQTIRSVIKSSEFFH